MENDYDRSEDDAWHGRIAAGRILSVLAAERLRAPRARTLWGTPAGARGSRSRGRGVAWDHGRWDQKRETRSYVCQRRTQIREYQAKREVRKVTVPAGPHPLHGPPARGPARRLQTGHDQRRGGNVWSRDGPDCPGSRDGSAGAESPRVFTRPRLHAVRNTRCA